MYFEGYLLSFGMYFFMNYPFGSVFLPNEIGL